MKLDEIVKGIRQQYYVNPWASSKELYEELRNFAVDKNSCYTTAIQKLSLHGEPGMLGLIPLKERYAKESEVQIAFSQTKVMDCTFSVQEVEEATEKFRRYYPIKNIF